jgi:hypothetical protein
MARYRVKTCPQCGAAALSWYGGTSADDGDVEPHEVCTGFPELCDWEF